MKKLTMRLTMAAAVLVAAAGAASAQVMKAEIPFAFRVGDQVMEPGTYRVDDLMVHTNTPIFRLSNVHSHQSTTLMPQAPVDPRKAWKAEGSPKLVFACGSGRCALAELWPGSDNHAYKFRRPRPGKEEGEYLTVIPMQRDKSE